MKTIIVIVSVLLFCSTGYTQEYKLAKSTGRLEIKEVNSVLIEGSTGSEIVFSLQNGTVQKDKRAEGLRAINSMGLQDNTGIGLAVVDKGTTYEVYQLRKMEGPNIKITVPRGVTVSYSHSSPFGSDVTFKNVASEIEVSTVHNSVTLDNITGPATVNTVHGEISATFAGEIKSPISLISAHGLVDVTVPATTKANLTLSTSFGQIYVDPAFKIDMQKDEEGYTSFSNTVNGKINGGGLDMTLTSTHGTIYLRKK